MEVSVRAKERFCRDCNVPIKVFQEPYFTDRLKLFDKFYETLNKWDVFVEELQKYKNEQDYFEEYNRVKDAAINCIKESEAYQMFNDEDMNKFQIKHKGLPAKDIFHPDNDGKMFLSIDMRKANFSSLQNYGNSVNKSMFAGASTWEDFISLFTDNKHIISSKYVRQVVLGNCNPKRHITYEKYLMDQVVDALIKQHYPIKDIVFFSNDEIVLNMESQAGCLTFKNIMQLFLDELFDIPFKVELFKLHKIKNTDGYYKEIFEGEDFYLTKSKIEFKCLDNYMFPFVLRHFLGEEVTESDKVFYHEGLLAKFMEVPEIEVNLNEDKSD